MLVLLAMLQFAPQDSMPRVTLAEALQRATRLDPNYVRAAGNIGSAEWARRAALLTFVLPSVTVSADYTRYNQPTLNPGISDFNDPNFLTKEIYAARVDASYDLFLGGGKFAGLSGANAGLESARASEVQQRYLAALQTERSYYNVLAGAELARIARDRVQRADQSLGVARARVVSGAAVQTDSLQLALELSRARVNSLVQEAALRVARLQLGRRIGVGGPADAVPLDSAAASELPLSLPDAISEAADQGPQYRIARANERQAAALLRVQRGQYLPRLTLSASSAKYDDTFFPSAATRSQVSVTASFPLWNDGRREIAYHQALVNRDVARAIREDFERAIQHDVDEAYEAYETARASTALSESGVAVARENFRVQDTRYRSGAVAILDVIKAQNDLSDAEAALVQSRYATRLALAALEAVLGRRLFDERESQ